MEIGRKRKALSVIDHNADRRNICLSGTLENFQQRSENASHFEDRDEPEPMFLEEHNDEAEEVEMEDIFEEKVVDIDECDRTNVLEVVEYVEDLHAHYRKLEEDAGSFPWNYMSRRQFDMDEKMRAILVDWLITVHDKFRLREETLFLTVNIVDRFLAKQAVAKNRLQLVGLIAMLLASKYEEVYIPSVDDLIFISHNTYSRLEFLRMERLILNVLRFNLSSPTPYVFMRRFLKAAQSGKKVELISFFLVELCLVEYEMLKFPPSMLSAAAIYTAHCVVYGFGKWSKTSECHSGYKEEQLADCSRWMAGLHRRAGDGNLTGVYRKYSASKFDCVATDWEPAMFLVGDSQKIDG